MEVDEKLTPHGIKLRDQIFPNIDFHDYQIDVGEYDDCWFCRVSHGNRHERRLYFVKEAVMGSHLGDVHSEYRALMECLATTWWQLSRAAGFMGSHQTMQCQGRG
jgi:hypothetical protein